MTNNLTASIVYLKEEQKYLTVSKVSIYSTLTPLDMQLTVKDNKQIKTRNSLDAIYYAVFYDKSIDLKEKRKIVQLILEMKKIEIYLVNLVSNKKTCFNDYLKSEVFQSFKQNDENLKKYNTLNSQLNNLLKPYLNYENVMYWDNYNIREKEVFVCIEKFIKKDKRLSHTQKEAIDYAIINEQKILQTAIDESLYKIQTDNSFIIYLNSGNNEGFISANNYFGTLSSALSFDDINAAKNYCKRKGFSKFKIIQLSLNITKEVVSQNCVDGMLLQNLVFHQEKSFLEKSMQLQEFIDLKEKVLRYESILKENGLLQEKNPIIKKTNKL